MKCHIAFLLWTFALFVHAQEKRPNILFAFADDWGRYASAYGQLEPGGPNDLVKTPNFDRVAKEGVLFRNAFVTAPSCTPCRSSLLSGQYFWRTGRAAILQGAVWDSAIPSYPLLLKETGYHIGFTAKVWSPGAPADAPYGGKERAYTKHGGQFSRFSQFVEKASSIEAGKEELYDQVRGNFQDFIADRKEGQPFCYWFGPTNVHRKWIQGSGKKHWGLDPDQLKGKIPPFLPDVPIVREDFADYLGEIQAFDAMLGVLLKELESLGELDNTMIVVSGDHGFPGMPQGKCNLYDFGVAVPLAVRWAGRVPAGRVVDDFVNLTDLAPTFLETAGSKPLEVMTGRSLMPLLASEKSGMIDETRDHVVVGRERHVAKARSGQLPYPQRAIRTKDFLYIRSFKPDRWPMGSGPGMGASERPMPPFEQLRENTFAAFADLDGSPTKAWIVTHREDPKVEKFFKIAFGRRPAEELYDLKKDPHQMTNVASDESYKDQRDALEARLLAVLRETGDPRVTGDGATYDLPPFAGE
ncbi:MAG: N-sulfoglucosamine sulfohydrolase [Verrucomicrobiales bacterium]|jgi:N-sulfoglucosamine sulfohydrolase